MFRSLSTSAIALVLGAAPVLADVTPAQVWENLRQSYEDMGYRVQVGEEQVSGDTLTLNNITLRSASADAADATFTLPGLVLQQQGGDVRSVVESPMTVQMRDTDPDGEEVGFALTITAPGNEIISSGSPEAMEHRYTMPTLTMEGRALDAVNETPVKVTVTDIQGRQTSSQAADGSSQQSTQATAAAADLSITAEGPSEVEGASEATDSFAATLSIKDLAISGTSSAPGGDVDFASQPEAALAAGFAAQGTFTMGALSGSFQSSTADEEGLAQDSEGSFAADKASVAVAISDDGLTYEASAADVETQITSSEMPFPLAYAVEENSFRLAFPTVASQEEQPFAFSYTLKGLTLDDAIWQSFDPEGALSRDPANLTLDLEGMAVLAQSFLNPDFAEGEETPQMPMSPRSLTINDLSLNALGANAELDGQLTFGDDPSQPVGTITGTFSGINGLMDNLVAMGIVPQEQLMGARMMLAMFARPVEGQPDQLQTELKFVEGGSIYANGQQVK
nr:DUF2125 domain-containing protein [Paracoccus saliphilus]